jgi:hypothetical protein
MLIKVANAMEGGQRRKKTFANVEFEIWGAKGSSTLVESCTVVLNQTTALA